MRSTIAASLLLASMIGIDAAGAAECPAGAMGVSRTIVVDPSEHVRLGAMQYNESLPLKDREVVLTFDDGPLPPYTSRVLDTLASECVKATFFLVGRMVRGYPTIARRIYNEGHTVANHSQSHPFTFHKMSVDQASQEIEDGFASLRWALGEPKAVAPFFRIPGLLRQSSVEQYLAAHNYMTWSVDFAADDWTHINAQEITRRAISRIEARGKGILLLHDIQPATALGLPTLLQQLKARGYRIVHVVQAGPDYPKTATLPEQWMARTATRTVQDGHWPLINVASLTFREPERRFPDTRNFGISDASGTYEFGVARADRLRGGDHDIRLPATSIWRNSARIVGLPFAEELPAPDASNFRYARVWKARPMVARRGTPTPKGPATASTVAPTPTPVAAPAFAPRGAPPPAPKNNNVGPQPPRPPRPIGHQLQLPKPNTTLGG
jgi:peptidoglycan/xylan/chitin deacetylase (PgdA/CDA1 family)